MKKTRQLLCVLGILPLTIVSLNAGSDGQGKSVAAAPDKVVAGDNNALIDALIKKGVLTNEEAKSIQSDLDKQASSTPGGFLKLGSNADKGLRLYGDARLRYEYLRDGRNGGANQERERYRYRLRVGAEYKFTDNFSSGVRFRSGESRRTGNSDFGTGNSTYSPNDKVEVDLVYLSWDKAFGAEWLGLTAGRIVQPHNFTGYSWAGDLTADGGAIKLGTWNLTDSVTLGSTHGAYVWTDAIDNLPTAGGSDDTFLFINQIDVGFKFNKDWNLRVSPGFVSAIGDNKATSGSTNINNEFVNNLSDLDVLTLNIALNTPFFIKDTKGKLFAEYGVNFSADERAKVLGSDGGDNQFFNFGYEVTKGKGKGAVSVELSYAYYEALSWSQQLLDTAYNNQLLNGHGPGIKVGYNISDNINASVLYRKSWRIDSEGAAVGGNQTGTDLVQVDLNWKF